MTSCRTLSGGYIIGVTPVPIPNTVVKPDRADDTGALRSGKVGHCQILSKKALCRVKSVKGLFFALNYGNSLLEMQTVERISRSVLWK